MARKTNRRNKRKAPYTPKANARKELTRSMRSLFKVLDRHDGEVRHLCIALDNETDTVKSVTKGALGDFMGEIVAKLRSDFLELSKSSRDELLKIINDADASAARVVEDMKTTHWADIRDASDTAELTLSMAEVDATNVMRNFTDRSIGLFYAYNGHSEIAKAVFGSGGDRETVLKDIAEFDADVAKKVADGSLVETAIASADPNGPVTTVPPTRGQLVNSTTVDDAPYAEEVDESENEIKPLVY